METQFVTILRAEMEKYAVEGINSLSYLTENLDQTVFTCTTTSKRDTKTKPFVDLFVRVMLDSIIIEEDRNSKPLVDALVQAGIPREQIILAYAGEKVPDTSA